MEFIGIGTEGTIGTEVECFVDPNHQGTVIPTWLRCDGIAVGMVHPYPIPPGLEILDNDLQLMVGRFAPIVVEANADIYIGSHEGGKRMAVEKNGTRLQKCREEIEPSLTYGIAAVYQLLVLWTCTFLESGIEDALALMVQGVINESVDIAEEAAIGEHSLKNMAFGIGTEKDVGIGVSPDVDILLNITLPCINRDGT